MKMTIVALAAILAIGVIATGCAQAAAIRPTAKSNVQSRAMVAVGSTTDQERLELVQHSTQMLINQYLMTGQPVPEYLNETTQAIEKAKKALLDLDGQRSGMQMLINQHLMAGEPAPDYDYSIIDSIERSRQEILKGVGLVE